MVKYWSLAPEFENKTRVFAKTTYIHYPIKYWKEKEWYVKKMENMIVNIENLSVYW